jgi:hypothetical protein
MPLSLIIFILFWIIIVATAYLYIRKHRPEWVGLGKEFNKQKIDGVRYAPCPKCSCGSMEPKFRWWQYCLGLTLPPGIMYVAGRPYIFVCSNCNHISQGIDKKGLFTRISLTHKLSREFLIAVGVDSIIAFIVFGIWFTI